MLHDPIVLDPPDFDLDQAWKNCAEYVEQCGGMQHPDGEPNMRAAAGADPGICFCPRCGAQAWAFGLRQKCGECEFEYPTRWLFRFRDGQYAAKFWDPRKTMHYLKMLADDPYYLCGYENPEAERPIDAGPGSCLELEAEVEERGRSA